MNSPDTPESASCPQWVIEWAEASQFLTTEAALLDRSDLRGWLELLSPEIEYLAPVRSTRYRGEPEFSTNSFHFEDDLFSLQMRVERLDTKFAWAEDPPTRTRHLVANVTATARSDGGLDVCSDVLLRRSRLDEVAAELVTAQRNDWLERTDGELRLRRRLVFVDATTLPLSTISTFL